jgi:uncharacterized integral membrane protein
MSNESTATTDSAPVRFLKERWIPIVVFLAAVLFIAFNREETQVSLVFMTVHIQLWIALAGVFLAGWIVGAARTRGKARRKAAGS